MNRLLNIVIGAFVGGPVMFAACGFALGVLGYA